MKYLLAILTLAMMLFYRCDVKTQDKGENEVSVSQTEPYQIAKGDKFITIPDSLRPANFHEGMLVIDYYVDSNGDMEGTNLGLLRIKDKAGSKLIWYRNKNMEPISFEKYPEDIQPFLNWAFAYAKTRKVDKVAEPTYDARWKLSIMLRLK